VLLPLSPPATIGATMSNIDKSVFLGCGEVPVPVWPDEAADADNWPDAAVFKVHFNSDNSRGASTVSCELPQTEFFGRDGWPCEFPEDLKRVLSNQIKLELQTFPWGWTGFSSNDWRKLSAEPSRLSRSRAMAAIARLAVQATSQLPLT